MIGLGDLAVHRRSGEEGCGTRRASERQGGWPGPVVLAWQLQDEAV
jgi:hypothetical protein